MEKSELNTAQLEHCSTGTEYQIIIIQNNISEYTKF